MKRLVLMAICLVLGLGAANACFARACDFGDVYCKQMEDDRNYRIQQNNMDTLRSYGSGGSSAEELQRRSQENLRRAQENSRLMMQW